MADAQRTIDLIFNGVDKTAAATLSALGNADKFASKLQVVTQPISDFTVGAVKLEGALLGAGLAMTAFAVKIAGDFDSAFREIATLIDRPIEDLGEFRQAILDYASSSTAPLDQVTLAIYNAISAGVPLAESIEAVSVAEKLSVAGKADLNDTLRVLVSSLNAYGVGMDKAGEFSDALFTAVKQGQTTLPELANTLSNVTGAAAALGVPFQTVLAALSTLTAAGTPTSQAVTQINAVLTSLIKPSKQAADLAAELGIEFGAQAVTAKGLEGVLADVARATGGNKEQMGLLFGSVEALKAVFPLTGSAAGKFAGDLAAMSDSAGATSAAFDKMGGDISLSAQTVSNAFTALMVAIGTPLLDEFGGVAESIAAVFTALGSSVKEGGLKTVVGFIESLFADLQTTIAAVAQNLPAALSKADFSGFTGGIKAVADAFKVLFGNIDLSSVDGLTRAIELSGAAFLGLGKFTAGVVESFKPLFDLLVKMGSELDTINPDWFEFAGNLGGAVTQFNLLLGGLTGLIPALEVLVGLLVVNQGMSLVGAIKLLTGMLPAFTLSLSAAGAAAAGVFAADQVLKLAGALIEWKKAQDGLSSAQERSQTIQQKVTQAVEDFAARTGLAVSSLEDIEALIASGEVVWSAAANAYVKAGDALAETTEAAVQARNPFGAANDAMLAAAAAAEATAAPMGDLADSTKDLVKTIPGIVPVFDAATGKIIGYEQGLVKATDAGAKLGDAVARAEPKLKTSGDVMEQLARKTNLTNDELIELAKNTKQAEIELEKIASNERIKLIEAKVQIDIARVQADAEKVIAAFDSINNTVTSTGDVLGKLFSLFGDYSSLDWAAIRAIEDQIDKENGFRQQALELQKRLTEAQIQQMEAQTRSLERGDAMIQIDGAGLQPHLEAFMWEILRAIQVRVNQDGLKMLLGV